MENIRTKFLQLQQKGGKRPRIQQNDTSEMTEQNEPVEELEDQNVIVDENSEPDEDDGLSMADDEAELIQFTHLLFHPII